MELTPSQTEPSAYHPKCRQLTGTHNSVCNITSCAKTRGTAISNQKDTDKVSFPP